MLYLPKIACIENLHSSFKHVAANRSGPGSDGVTIEQFSNQLEQHLAQISYEIMHKTYQFQPALGIELTRENRTVFVLNIRDRVTNQAIAQILSNPLEKYLHPANYSYRAGRSAVEASILLQKELSQKQFPYVLKCDIHHYFDSVDHEILHSLLKRSLGEESADTIRLVLHAIKNKCLIEGGLRETIKGICQGSPLSPLLSNLYLAPFDRYLEKRGFRHIRFSDDIIILLQDSAQGKLLRQEIENFLQAHLKLKLHPNKGGIFAFQDGFNFLGFHFSPSGRFPGKEAAERLQARLQNAKNQAEKLEAVQRWEAYYGKGTASAALLQNPSKEPQCEEATPLENEKPEGTNMQDMEIQDLRHLEAGPSLESPPRWPKIVSIFLDLFRGNPNAFAHAYQSENRYGYAPVHRPISPSDIITHLLGKETLGVYPLHHDQAAFSCLDLDLDRATLEEYAKTKPGQLSVYQDTLLQHTRAIQKILQELGIEPLLEESGYKGYHLWVFAQNFIPAILLSEFWKKILTYTGPAPAKMQREIFPRETISDGRLGSLIKLPLGIHPHSGRRSMFLDKAGAIITNPQNLLQNAFKASESILQAIVTGKKAPASLPSTDIEKMIHGCNVVKYLHDQAIQEHILGHFARCILLYTIGQLGEDGEKYLHYLLKHCKNYNYNITQKYIATKHASPMGCRRIQEIMGESLNEIECCCTFPNLPSGGYASPMLHVYPNATKNLGGRKGRD